MKTLSLLLLLLSAPSQDPTATRAVTAPAPANHVRIESMVGAEIELLPTPPDRATPPPIDPRSAACEAETLLVASDGSIEWLVVTLDERQVLVPTERCRWDATTKRFSIDRTRAELALEPAFDYEAARRSGLAAVIDERAEAWGVGERRRARSASSDRGRRYLDTQWHIVGDVILRADQLDELDVYGRRDAFGGVRETFVDPVAMRVDLVVVSRDDDGAPGATLVPFRSFTVCRKADDDGDWPGLFEPTLCLPLTVEELQAAPRYDVPEERGVLVTKTNREAAYRFFERARPVSESG